MSIKLMVLLAFLGIVFLNTAYCCSSDNGDDGGDDGDYTDPEEPESKGPLKECFGDDVYADKYAYTTDDDDIAVEATPDDLYCDFDSDCCWGNAQDDELEFVELEADEYNEDCFDGEDEPDGTFIGLAPTTDKSSDEARFISCPVTCMNNPEISLRSWQKDGYLEVCLYDPFEGEEIECQEVDSGDQVVYFDNGPYELASVMLRASGFDSDEGGIVAVDDLEVYSEECSNACELECTFADGDDCGWEAGTASGDTTGFRLVDRGEDLQRTQGQNLDTGVRGSPNGQESFMATELNRPSEATMSHPVRAGPGQYLKYQYYEATQGVQVRACKDSCTGECNQGSNRQVTIDDLEWKDNADDLLPLEGAESVVFCADNESQNLGAVGVGDIQVVDESGNPVCDYRRKARRRK